MNVVDSSGWLEYFADTPNAAIFAELIIDTENLIVPSISIFEVFKRILQQRDQNAALQAVALMRQGRVVSLDETLALHAAKLGIEHKLPLADSVMLATARAFDAVLWTQDADFAGIDGVRFVRKTAG